MRRFAVARPLQRYLLAAISVAFGFAGMSPPATGQNPGESERKALRVCQDPNNLPFSNRKLEGFENKIAELLGRDLGWRVEYTWYPQRFGFIRNTLRAAVPEEKRFKCDLVIGVPVGYELTSTTKPYYRSTYALVYVKGKGFDGVQHPRDLLELEPAKLKNLKVGVFVQSPAVDWMLKYGLIDNAVSYQKQTSDPDQHPGEVLEKDLVAGTIDMAFIWGPIAGYFAKKVKSVSLAVIPLKSEPEIKFDYSIAMGVRHGERDWKAQIEKALERNQPRIDAILAEYGVPVVPDSR